jgi:hypothetical protein
LAYGRSGALGRWPRAGEGEWRTGSSMSHPPKLERQRGGRETEKGSGDRKLVARARSGVREKARRAVWGEVRCGAAGAPFYWGQMEAKATRKSERRW